jgi:hypothetical protein
MARTKSDQLRMTVQMPPGDFAALTKWARSEGRPAGNLMRKIVADALFERDSYVNALADVAGAAAASQKQDRRTKRVKAP